MLFLSHLGYLCCILYICVVIKSAGQGCFASCSSTHSCSSFCSWEFFATLQVWLLLLETNYHSLFHLHIGRCSPFAGGIMMRSYYSDSAVPCVPWLTSPTMRIWSASRNWVSSPSFECSDSSALWNNYVPSAYTDIFILMFKIAKLEYVLSSVKFASVSPFLARFHSKYFRVPFEERDFSFWRRIVW